MRQITQSRAGRQSWIGFGLVATFYLATLCLMGTALWHNVGFPLDDSWIHQVIARNLIRFHSFGFEPGVSSSGSSSTLWTFVLSVHYVLFAHVSPVWFPLLLNAALLIATGLLLWRMAALDELPVQYAIALAALPALSGNLVWLAFIGMEHVLFLFLSVVAILLWYARPDTAATAIAAGAALGALGMTRPEGLALSVLLFVCYRLSGRSLRDVVRAGTVALLFLLPSFVLNLKTSGSLLPTTMRGRRFLYLGTDKLHIGRSTVRGLTRETYFRILQHHFFLSTRWWVAVLVACAVWGTLVLLWRFRNRTAMLCAWAVVHYAAYCFTLPAAGHGGRYQPFVLLLFPAVMAIGLLDLLQRAGKLLVPVTASTRWLPWLGTAVLLGVAVLTSLTLPRWRVALRDSIYDIDHSHLAMAEWLNAHYPAGTPVGVFDIGVIGYFSDVHVVDLGGLVDRHFTDYLVSGRVPEYLLVRHIAYVVVPHSGSETRFGDQLHFLHNPAIRLVPLHTDGIDYATWESSYVYTQHAYRFQTLYRLQAVPLPEQTPTNTERDTWIAANAVPDR